MKNRLLLSILLSVISVCCYSTINFPYYLYSENGQFFLKSIPHNDQEFEIEGRTDIFRTSDSTLLYSIPRYFNPDELILSNDGMSILYAKHGIANYKGNDDSLVLFYQKGTLKHTFDAGELIIRDTVTRFSNFFYYNFNLFHWDYDLHQRVYTDTVEPYMQKILEDPFYGHDSIAYIATRDK